MAWLGAWVGAARPLIDQSRYRATLALLHEHILAGDIYQANYTFPAEVRFAGHPLAVYAALRARARAGHGAGGDPADLIGFPGALGEQIDGLGACDG